VICGTNEIWGIMGISGKGGNDVGMTAKRSTSEQPLMARRDGSPNEIPSITGLARLGKI